MHLLTFAVVTLVIWVVTGSLLLWAWKFGRKFSGKNGDDHPNPTAGKNVPDDDDD